MKKESFLGIVLSLILLAGLLPGISLKAGAAETEIPFENYYLIVIEDDKWEFSFKSSASDYSSLMVFVDTNTIAVNKDLLESSYPSWDVGTILYYTESPEVDGYHPGYITDRNAFVGVDPSTLTDFDSYYTARSALSNAALADAADEDGVITVYVAWFEMIESMTLTVEAPLCGEEIGEESYPTITNSAGENWELYAYNETQTGAYWVEVDEDNYPSDFYIGTVTGGETYAVEMDFDALYGYYFNPDLTASNVTVNYTDADGNTCNGTVIYMEMMTSTSELDYNMICFEVTAQHVPGETVTENEVEPTCLEDGSHEEAVYCEVCEEELSRESVTDEALGHDWGDWVVVTEPQIDVAGLEQRVCKRDASHIETREIDPLVGCTVTFESNGGTAVEDQIVVSGETAEEPDDPDKGGYTFDGWYEDEALTEAFDFSTAITEDITLYAKWDDNPKTGDAVNGIVWMILMGGCAAGAAILWQEKKRRAVKE